MVVGGPRPSSEEAGHTYEDRQQDGGSIQHGALSLGWRGGCRIAGRVGGGEQACAGDLTLTLQRGGEQGFEQVAFDDDSVPGTFCATLQGYLTPGTWRFRSEGVNGRGIGPYTFNLQLVSPEAIALGEVPAEVEARGLSIYALEVGAAGRLVVTPLDGGCLDSVQLALWSLDPVARLSLSEVGCAEVSAPVAPGTYHVQVRAAEALNFTLRSLVLGERAEGQDCDRAGLADTCAPSLLCLMGEADGVGVCGPLFGAPVPEVEPEGTPAEAAQAPVQPTVIIDAHIDGGDVTDTFALQLDEASRVRVSTGSPAGCPADTRLFRIPADAASADLGIASALAGDDDGGEDRCSLLVEDLDAGLHLYVVEPFNRGESFDYQLTAQALPGADAVQG